MRLDAVLAVLLCAGWALAAPDRKDHAPRMSYLDNGVIRLGVDLNLGGAITYLSQSKPELNLVNSFDWGRQIQMSYYSGPVPFEPNGKKPRKDWAGLGWNPIQSGDCFNYASKVLEHRNDGKEVYVKCVPMQWPLENEPCECTFESWIRLEGPAALVRSRINNARSDKTQYRARSQEMPAVYTNGPFHRLMTYTGDKPFTGGELVRIQKEFKMSDPWARFLATEGWAALVNDDGFGLGVYQPGCLTFLGGFAGKPGKGGPKDDPTGYIAPIREEILDHNIGHEYGYAVIVGKVEEIRAWAKESAAKGLPDWRFEKDRQGWWYAKGGDAGWPIKGELKLTAEKGSPQVISPEVMWSASDAPSLHIHAAIKSVATTGRVYWKTHAEPKFTAEKSMSVAINGDGQYRVYTVNLKTSSQYAGKIIGLRIDPALDMKDGDSMRVDWIGFEDEEARKRKAKAVN